MFVAAAARCNFERIQCRYVYRLTQDNATNDEGASGVGAASMDAGKSAIQIFNSLKKGKDR